MKYAEVILPLPLAGTFTYTIPESFPPLQTGHRVIVSFGPKKVYTGIVHSLHNQPPQQHLPKPIREVLDDAPILLSRQLKLFEWIAAYYMCTLGEVTNAALPSALKLTSESYISLKAHVSYDHPVSDQEYAILSALEQHDLSIKDIGLLTGLKYPQRIIKKLADTGYVDLYEKVKDKYQPKTIKKIRLSRVIASESAIEALVNGLDTKPKQQEVVLAFLKESNVLSDMDFDRKVSMSVLLQNDISSSSLQTLIKNNVLEESLEVISRLEELSHKVYPDIGLSDAQSEAYRQLKNGFSQQPIQLLHGITGSGKTEIYIQLIRDTLEEGKQVLFLLPEIALTTQIISRLYKVFGSDFGVYHSRYSDNERVEVWNKVLNNEYQFVVGVRSAVFLPFQNLGLIIVDEEHEPSYKQFEPAPNYHARDTSIYLAQLHGAKTLLGTATPALDTYYNVQQGKYGLVELFQRYGHAQPPEIVFANINWDRKRKQLKGNFTALLAEKIEASLKQKEQVILFQNRRGYASYVQCDDCATIPKCPNCAVSLTYHQYNHKLVCHYCGFNQTMYSDCLECGSSDLRNVGFGTEELEEEVKLHFPDAIVQRMDLDTTRSKMSYQRIIENFEEGNVDILVGTQMVSKGLDFDHVNLVGIFDADRLIHFPDFRSHERAYQLIYQVSGRAGRRLNKGLVVIQTNDPEQDLLLRIQSHDYKGFFQREMLERERFSYPPLFRLIRIVIKHHDKHVCGEGARFFHQQLLKGLSTLGISGPTEPLIGKIRNQYLQEILLKIPKHGINLPAIKEYLFSIEKMLKQVPNYKRVGVVFDVDPV